MEGHIRAFSRNLEGQESSYSNSYEEKSKNIWTYTHIPMYVILRSNLRVHVSMGLKIAYSNKQGFLMDELGTTKDNMSPWGLKSLQRDREGHQHVINHVW